MCNVKFTDRGTGVGEGCGHQWRVIVNLFEKNLRSVVMIVVPDVHMVELDVKPAQQTTSTDSCSSSKGACKLIFVQ